MHLAIIFLFLKSDRVAEASPHREAYPNGNRLTLETKELQLVITKMSKNQLIVHLLTLTGVALSSKL